MHFYLMRHADAVTGNGGDYARVLSDKGRNQAEKMGAWLARLVAEPLLIVCSPYPRAHETATLLAKEMSGGATVQPDERLAPGMTTDMAGEIMHDYGRKSGSVMLVGHAPDCNRLAAHIIGANGAAVDIRKGGVAAFDTARAGFGGSTLEWLIHPKL